MARKTRKLAGVAIGIVIVLLIAMLIVNRYRDSIALELANRALRDTGMTVTDVSVSSVRADRVHFSEIVVALMGGARLHIEGVSLPVNFHGLAGSELHIEAITLVPGDAESGPLPLADWLHTYLEVPAEVPGASVRIDALLVPDMPDVRNFAWHADVDNPTMRASIGEFDVYFTTTPGRSGDHRASLRLLGSDDAEPLMLGFDIRPDGDGFVLRGRTVLRLDALLPVLHALGTLPDDIAKLAATLTGSFEARIGTDELLPLSVSATLATDSALEMSYRAAPQDVIAITALPSGPIAANFEYPSFDWTAEIPAVTLSFDAETPGDPVVGLQNLRCRSGMHCKTDATLELARLGAGELAVRKLAIAADSLDFVSINGDWTATSGDVSIVLQAPTYAGRRFTPPRISAELDASDDALAVLLDLSTPGGGFAGRADLSHDLARDSGRLLLEDAVLDFAVLNLSDIFENWPYDWDVAFGKWRVDGTLAWSGGDTGFAYEGESSHALESLAGHYGDTAFIGLDTEVVARFDSNSDVSLSQAAIEVELIDIGFPVEDVQSRLTLDPGAQTASVESLSMALLGGELKADPFVYDFGAEANALLLRASHIQLPLMVALADLDTVEISGSVSGAIPVTVKSGKVLIDGGHLENDPPGGTIRYGAATDPGLASSDSRLGVVTRTLKNFKFDLLTSDVDYSQDGDLKLQMRLTGVNPDVDATQPVILNLGIENNVPQMLRSLQATRSIEALLEKKLSR